MGSDIFNVLQRCANNGAGSEDTVLIVFVLEVLGEGKEKARNDPPGAGRTWVGFEEQK